MRPAKILLAAGVLGLAATGAAQAQSRTFELDGFDKVDIATGLDARVTIGADFSVVGSSRSQQALDSLELHVDNGVLEARIERSFLDFILSGGLVGLLLNSGNAVSLEITLPSLTAATASSGADIDLPGLVAETIALDASSGADIEVTGARLGAVTAEASSGSDITLEGTADRIRIDASSGANVDADALVSAEAEAHASSGASIGLHATAAVRARASSGGDIEVEGNPTRRDVETSSGGDVSFED